MSKRKEWVKEYHTPTAGTTYHIIIEDKYISLQALEKPYRLANVSIKDLEDLL